jgi:hypothetical protein
MKVFWARFTDTRDQVKGILIRHDDIGDDEVAIALADPAPERRSIAGRAHFIAGAR